MAGYVLIRPDAGTAEYAICDASGQLKAKGMASEEARIDLPSGIYVATLNGRAAKVQVRCLVLQR